MKKIFFNDKYGLTQAVLDGRKTMTRRIATYEDIKESHIGWLIEGKYKGKRILCGEMLVIAESSYAKDEVIAIAQAYSDVLETMTKRHGGYGEEQNKFYEKWNNTPQWENKMFVRADLMPHHICITDIKVERLQDISDEDCLREGIYQDAAEHDGWYTTPFFDFFGNEEDGFDEPREAFAALIDKVCGKGTWAANPYCFCYEFELID